MIIKIKSDNPELASLLRKNPESFDGFQLREVKNGVGIGRVVSPTEYHLVFQDTKYSFSGKDRSNQIDFQSYCNPRVFLTLASIFLRHLMYEREAYESDEIPWLGATNAEVESRGSKYVLEIENVYADGFSFNRGFVLNKYFEEINLERKRGCLFKLTVTADSLFRAVNLTALACVYLTTTNQQPFFVNKDIARKYIRVIKNLSPVPYFVLYLFARTCLPSKEIFEALRPELEDAFEGEVSLTWGNTQRMRINAISDTILDESGTIPEDVVLEVGCGEMDYPRALLGKLHENARWVSTDKVDFSHLVPAINRRHNTDKLSFQTFIENTSESFLILMIEMIEHMPYDEAVTLVYQYINTFKPMRVVITTPNFDFNKYFAIEGFRHDDHHFELNPDGFEKFIEEVASAYEDCDYDAKFFGIGDRVKEDYLSLGCLLTRI
jgi:hypothetical protein